MEQPSYRDALSYALKVLSRQPCSKSKLIERLTKKGYTSFDNAKVLKRLEELNLINDQTYAEQVTEELLHRRPSGKRRIWYALRKRKIPAAIAHEVISRISEGEETERAYQIAQLYKNKFKLLPTERRRKRIYDTLVRRGFNYELCREVIERIS